MRRLLPRWVIIRVDRHSHVEYRHLPLNALTYVVA